MLCMGRSVGEISFLFVVVYALYGYGIGYMGHVLQNAYRRGKHEEADLSR